MPLVNDMAPPTSGETYFFRDHGQFDLLRLRLLPELIERRRSARTLRLWSAGCASGEEAYSLAMLVDMLLPEHDGWDIVILGSDINQAALAKARRGRYGQWSFRMVPTALQQRYFQRMGDEWALDERIRRMVTFRAGNLIGEPSPGGEWRDMDLILCRNVFIYFAVNAVTAVADKLSAALSEGGYLLTGHTELIGHRVRDLRSRLFAEGVVYQRVAQAPYTPLPNLPPQAGEGAKKTPSLAHSAAEGVEAPSPVRSAGEGWDGGKLPVPPPAAPSREDLLATAREFADRGEYDRAEQTCLQALAVVPLAAGPHFLLAQLAQLRGDFERAGELLDQTLYLDPHCVAAYLEQAALCERAENLPRAQTLRRAALEIVRALPGDATIEPYETTAAEMAQWLAQ
ncbi:MAG: chemotaxis protein CheR [Deltaproteobacteria bacterium]|nr:chemotaxis protein CheR [Deltaproteobacteria bacterium]